MKRKLKKNLDMYCLSLNDKHYDSIKKLGYIPVGLGNKKFRNNWITDKIGKNISKKNPYYGEYTFHYCLWKNNFPKINNNKWIGFCQYRKFWVLKKNNLKKNIDIKELSKITINSIPSKFNKCDSIIGEPMYINQFRFSKFLKRNLLKMIFNPSFFFNKKKRNIKFHFDMWHGDGNLDKAINLLDSNDRENFKTFVNLKTSFNPHNMFICKKAVLIKYYNSVFPWLKECEKLFGFSNLKGFGLQRIYGFLAERYMSYWFRKNSKYKTLPIIFFDISKF
tara:strand:+ start:126 stop:959 length:834 start_codon:yes stop_codon:yes gene_type:complete